MTYLQITVRFLDERYHGLLARNGPPEWPPSPFRLFSAMVAGAAARNKLENGAGKALCWLQDLCRERPPMIIAPLSRTGNAILRYGPDNDDKFHSEPEACRSGIPTIPTLMVLESGQEPEVHYLWNIEGITDIPMDRLRDAARNLTRLGWGTDMAFANAKSATLADIQKLKGIRWHPRPGIWREIGMLRVPTADKIVGEDTLSDLKHCHQTALNRIHHGEARNDVDMPRVFDQVLYTSIECPIGRAHRVFELRSTDGSRFRYPHRKLIHIAGMVRHLAIEAIKNDPPRGVNNAAEWVASYIAGHQPTEERERGDAHRQLSYLPLPSVGREHTDPGVRRVMIAAPLGGDDARWLDHLARRLAGQLLKPEPGKPDPFAGREPPLLVPMPRQTRDGVVRCYTGPATVWHSITPVILPGHDDHKPAKTRKLIEKALAQSGVDQPCEFEWSAFSRFRKSYTAHKYNRQKEPQGYFRPDHLSSQTAVHLTVRFGRREVPSDPTSRWIAAEPKVPGPFVIGAGRHCGLGLLVAETETTNTGEHNGRSQ